MYLRKLKMKDAPYMLSWMRDGNVTYYLHSDFASKTLSNVEDFISKSHDDHFNIHLAIASDNDEYCGTVSLKHIANGCAEFAIVVRSDVMGRGFAWYGMERLLIKAFGELSLDTVYWCVSRENERAIRFYDKHHFHEHVAIPQNALERYRGVKNLIWYAIGRDELLEVVTKVSGCSVVRINTIHSEESGSLSFFESKKDIPFEVKRLYYISNVPAGTIRGKHAHKKLKQFLFCPYGRIRLTLENRNGKESLELSNPYSGILIEECTWRELYWIQDNSVLCVAASDYYQEEDYIRCYDEFSRLIKHKLY